LKYTKCDTEAFAEKWGYRALGYLLATLQSRMTIDYDSGTEFLTLMDIFVLSFFLLCYNTTIPIKAAKDEWHWLKGKFGRGTAFGAAPQ